MSPLLLMAMGALWGAGLAEAGELCFKGIALIGEGGVQERQYPEGISFWCLDPMEKLEHCLSVEFLGQPISKEELERLKERVAALYRKEGYPVALAAIPEGQEISSGVVQVAVLTGRVGKVCVEGARYFSNEKLLSRVRLASNDPVKTGPILRDLDVLNQNPYRTVYVFYEKGGSPGETDVNFVVKDRMPFRLFGGYENTGNIIAGDSRFLANISFGNLFYLDHQFSGQFFTAVDLSEWWAATASYTAPLPNGHVAKVFGNYSKTRPEDLALSDLPPPSTLNGFGWQVSGRYKLPLDPIGFYSHFLTFGYDFKRTNNFLTFSETLIFPTQFDISQFIAAYEGVHENGSGRTVVGVQLYGSPGGMTAFNHTANFQFERSGATSSYIYFRGSLDRMTHLPFDFSWMFSFLGQATSNTLMPSEEFSLGGFLTVRGYDENEIISDQGALLRNELRSPPFPLWPKSDGRAQILGFVDFGYANGVDPNVYNKNNALLASAGPGFRYKMKDYIDFYLDYGFQLIDIKDRPFVGNQHSRIHTGLYAGF